MYDKLDEKGNWNLLNILNPRKKDKKSTEKPVEPIKIPGENWKEISYEMDGSVKQLFLNLTKMQIPFDYEKTLVEFFPSDMEVDDNGNYFKQIGDSKTMFCGHLDTYCRVYERVWHVIDGDIIKTDGTSTLGGDDKAGIVVMIKMMEANVPGLYYFFRGEEGVTSPTGTWGSRQALKSRGDFFKGYEKCVAFDRKAHTSIISSQMYTACCSQEFVSALIEEFKKNGMEYIDDPTGMWCDSGVFMELIPEVTNISMGYKSEHTFNETQDIAHLEKLVEAAIKIDWDSLPVKRDPTKVTKSIGRYKYDNSWDSWDDNYSRSQSKSVMLPKTISNKSNKKEYSSMKELFDIICELLLGIDYDCLNPEFFSESDEIYFQNYDTNDFFGLRIIDFDIYLSDDSTLKKYTNIGSLEDFKNHMNIESDDYSNELDNELDRHLGKSYKEEDFNYTKEQIKAFTELAEKNKYLLKTVMDDMTESKSTTVDGKLWLDVDNELNKLGYKSTYDSSNTAINPDTFTEYVIDNWIEMQFLLKKV